MRARCSPTQFLRAGAALLALGAAPWSARGQTDHPIAARIRRDVPVGNTISLAAPPAALPARFAKARLVRTIAGSDANPFGRIDHVVFDSKGYVYVLDGEYNEVRVFSPAGREVQRLGYRQGSTNAFRSPAAIAALPDNRIAIADKARKVHFFRRQGDTLAFERTAAIPVSAYDLCGSGNDLVVQGFDLDKSDLVRTISADGRQIRSLATIYESPNKLVNLTFAHAQVACDGKRFLIVPETSIGEIRDYTTDGVAQWVTEIKDYVPVLARESGRSVEVRLPPAGYHRVQSVQFVDSTTALVQVAFVVPPATAKGDEVSITSLLVDVKTGRAQNIGKALGGVIAFDPAGSTYAVVQQKPVATIAIWHSAREGR